jgi:hypothetical protein
MKPVLFLDINLNELKILQFDLCQYGARLITFSFASSGEVLFANKHVFNWSEHFAGSKSTPALWCYFTYFPQQTEKMTRPKTGLVLFWKACVYFYEFFIF